MFVDGKLLEKYMGETFDEEQLKLMAEGFNNLIDKEGIILYGNMANADELINFSNIEKELDSHFIAAFCPKEYAQVGRKKFDVTQRVTKENLLEKQGKTIVALKDAIIGGKK